MILIWTVYVPQFGSDLNETNYAGTNNEFAKTHGLHIDYSIYQILAWQILHF